MDRRKQALATLARHDVTLLEEMWHPSEISEWTDFIGRLVLFQTGGEGNFCIENNEFNFVSAEE